MTLWLKQSVAAVIQFGPFLDATNAVSLETGLATAMDNVTTGIRISKNGGNIIARNATVTATAYDEMGLYSVTLDATDTGTLGNLKIIFEESATCLPVWQDFMIVPANVWDSLFGADNLDVNTAQVGGQTASASGTVTFPNATLASTTNITAGTIATATNVTTVNGLAAGVITAAATAADHIDLIWDEEIAIGHVTADSAGAVLNAASAPTAAAVATAVWTDTTASDFTTGLSVGKSVMNGVALGTGLTIVSVSGAVGSVTGHTNQTGDSFAIVNGTEGLVAIDTVVDSILVNTGTDIPALIGGIGTAGGASISVDSTTSNETGGITGVTSGTTLVGTSTATSTDTTSDYLAASVVDGEYHIITHAANAIDVVYQFLTGGGTEPVAVDWTGYLASANDIVTISAWDHVGVGWEAIGSIAGTGGTTNSVVNPTLFTRHRGTSAAELGKVYIRLHCTGQSSPVLSTDQLIVEYSVTSRSVGYANGSVWIDTVSGIAGTESFVNGVADNPVLTIADALTIATAVNLRKFEIGNGSTITLAATLANKVMIGHEWTLALGGQNVASSMFIDGAVSGTGTGADSEYEDCIFAITSLPAMQAYNCSFTANTSGGFTMSAAGDYRFINCQSGVAGASSPLFTLGTGAITAEFRRWSGGIAFAGITSDDVITISGEIGTIDLGSPSGAADIQIRGIYKAITNVGSATVNVAGAFLGADVASILVDTATTIPGTITTAQTDLDTITGSDGVTLATTQSLYAPAKAADCWSDSTPPAGTAMSRAVDGIVLGTASGVPTTTSIPTSSLVPAAIATDQFKGRIVTFDDATTTTALRGQSTDITASTAGGVLTVTALTNAPASGDTFTIQ